MNLLFISLAKINSIRDHGIYPDLLRVFVKNGHSVYIISPVERRNIDKPEIIKEGSVTILKIKIGNITKTNIIEKGISTVLLERILIRGIKKYFSDVKFDLVLYPTPPITFCNVVNYVKKRDSAKTYLLLKDIFPQNAVDLEMLSKTGVKGLIYKYFRRKEKFLYSISDRIGCMSQANVEYLLKHNPDINPSIVEICPNSIEVVDKSISEQEKITVRAKYRLPLDKTIFVYGGNLGKPQGVDFIIECLKSQVKNDSIFFLIVGNGTEYSKLKESIINYKLTNTMLLKELPKDEYDRLVAACDIGLIFLDHRFTIPNFPSRLLSYMQAKLPVLACTDVNTDIGQVIEEGNFGWWCFSNSTEDFGECIDTIQNLESLIKQKDNSYLTLLEKYDIYKYAKQIYTWESINS